jgi:PadR family transcriptional regulator PadR
VRGASPLTARAALLAALTRGGAHAFALIHRVRELTGGRVVLEQGSTYPALRHMEADGLVASTSVPPEPGRGGRHRAVYTLTPAGRRLTDEHRRAVAGLFGLKDPP